MGEGMGPVHGTTGNMPGAWFAGVEPYGLEEDITVVGSPAGFACDLIAEVSGGQLVKSMGKETWRAGSCLEVEQAVGSATRPGCCCGLPLGPHLGQI